MPGFSVGLAALDGATEVEIAQFDWKRLRGGNQSKMLSDAGDGAGASGGKFDLRFWGVRGGIPTTNAQTLRFGGNTPCIEVRCGNHLIILDAGTGIRQFGLALDQSRPIHADLVFSVCRFDHACGLPFFTAAYNPTNDFKVWGGHSGPGGSIKQNLSDLMISPLFPVPLSSISGLKAWGDFIAGDTFKPREGIRVRTAPLNNPSGATGYRVEYGGKALGYVSNAGHLTDQPDEAVLELIEACDLVIYDSYFYDEEIADGALLGHSTWQEGLRLCKAAGAKRMAAFQHHPGHLDDELLQVQSALDGRLPGSFVAFEGQTAHL